MFVKKLPLIVIIFFVCSIANASTLDSLIIKHKQSDSDSSRALECLSISSYYELLEIDSAIAWGLKAVNLGKRQENKLVIVKCLIYCSTYYFRKADYKSQIEICLEALPIAEQIGRLQSQATITGNLGSAYTKLNKLDEAYKWLIKSLAIKEEIGNESTIAVALNNIAGIFQRKGEAKLAINFLQRSLKIRQTIGDSSKIARAHQNLGVGYLEIKDYQTAEEHLLIAHNYRIKSQDPSDKISTYYYMSWFYGNTKNYKKALEYGKIGFDEAKEHQNYGYIIDISQHLADIYYDLKDYKNACDYKTNAIKFTDSLITVEENIAIVELETKYETTKKEQENEILRQEAEIKDLELENSNAELKNQQIVIWSSSIGLLLLIGFAISLINRNRIKQKANNLLAQKNEEILIQKNEAEYQRELVAEKNEEITDSITYAQHIQTAILPPLSYMKEYLKEIFVLYKPKDIVAGDFYWLEEHDGYIYFSAADCTGHGVPGAMMSVMCSNALTKCVKEMGITEPAKILDETSNIIESRFERSEKLVMDGMDLALCKLDPKTLKMEYAGANNPLWIVRKSIEEVEEIKADRQPIGTYETRVPFKNNKVQLNKGDSLYIFSDGYVDQFGGPKGKKFKSKPFKKLILSLQNHAIAEQLEHFDQAFESWRGETEQIDDVCVIGVKI